MEQAAKEGFRLTISRDTKRQETICQGQFRDLKRKKAKEKEKSTATI